MGLEAGGRRGTKEEKKEKEEEKISHMCESIGHRPLRGRCPKRRKEERKKRNVTCRNKKDKEAFTNALDETKNKQRST